MIESRSLYTYLSPGNATWSMFFLTYSTVPRQSTEAVSIICKTNNNQRQGHIFKEHDEGQIPHF